MEFNRGKTRKYQFRYSSPLLIGEVQIMETLGIAPRDSDIYNRYVSILNGRDINNRIYAITLASSRGEPQIWLDVETEDMGELKRLLQRKNMNCVVKGDVEAKYLVGMPFKNMNSVDVYGGLSRIKPEHLFLRVFPSLEEQSIERLLLEIMMLRELEYNSI